MYGNISSGMKYLVMNKVIRTKYVLNRNSRSRHDVGVGGCACGWVCMWVGGCACGWVFMKS